MSYSDHNPAWGRMMRGRELADKDVSRQDVVLVARAVRRDNPSWSWGRCVECAEFLCGWVRVSRGEG